MAQATGAACRAGTKQVLGEGEGVAGRDGRRCRRTGAAGSRGSWWRTKPMAQTLSGGVPTRRRDRPRRAPGARWRRRRAPGRGGRVLRAGCASGGMIPVASTIESPRMPSFSTRRSVVLASVLVISILGILMETALRVVGVGAPVRPRLILRLMDSDITLPFMRADPEVFWSPIPGYRGEFMGKPVRINALGLRGPEIAEPRPAGRRRVASFGDSITFGYGVGDEETYPHALGEELGGPRRGGDQRRGDRLHEPPGPGFPEAPGARRAARRGHRVRRLERQHPSPGGRPRVRAPLCAW